MKSILENRPALAREVNQVAEVAGYLWQKGWAERNGGNITLNITEYIDDEIRSLPAISEVKQIGKKLPFLKRKFFPYLLHLTDSRKASDFIIYIFRNIQSYITSITFRPPFLPKVTSHLCHLIDFTSQGRTIFKN